MLAKVVHNLSVYCSHVVEILEDRFAAGGVFLNALDCSATYSFMFYNDTCSLTISILPGSYADKSEALEFILQYWESIS